MTSMVLEATSHNPFAKPAENKGSTQTENAGPEFRTYVDAVDQSAGRARPAGQHSGEQAKTSATPQQNQNASATEREITRLENSFASWKSDYMGGGISQDRAEDVVAFQDRFLHIIGKAVREGGYENPEAFIKSLSPDELETLRVMSGLANRIQPQNLDKEGALNLFLPRNEARDIDNDGMTTIGIGKLWSFPPPNAADNVKAAWAEATAVMSDGDRMVAMGQFMFGLNPGANPYGAEGFSYTNEIQKRLEALEFFKGQTPHDQYETKKAFLDKFLSALERQNVA